MRHAITGSAAVHLVVLLALLIVRTSTPILVAGPETVQVALYDPSALRALSAAEPTPAPAPVPAEDETGVRIEKPKPDPKKPEPRPEAPRPAAPSPSRPPGKPASAPSTNVSTLPMAGLGGPGLRGSLSVDARDFEFTYYLRLVRDQIARNWSAPAGLSTGGKPVQAVVNFHIARDGGISGVRVEESSGLDFFDQSAARAVTISDPLPPLPLGFPAGDLGVHFGFEYTGP